MALVLAVAVCLLAAPATALAEEFVVDSTADEVDSAPGDEFCATAEGDCTLRAAIEESDALEESAQIEFEEVTFEGQAGATIALGSALPPITVPMFVNGRTCDNAAGLSGPCVGIEGQAGEAALVVEGAEEVEIWGLAITGAQTAVTVEESPRFKAQASWFGVGLDGAAGPNGTGVLVGPGSTRSLIGSEGAERRDVFAGNEGDGLDVHGAREVRVLGDYFGVGPDGATPAANGGDDIEVVSVEGREALDASIGTRPGAAAAATPQCDGGCNVIAAAGRNGVDLAGDGGVETAAVSPAVLGNHIGLDATGTVAVANAGAGVRVGEAVHATIGGPAAGEANVIDGGATAVLAGPAAPDLAIRGNLIGSDAAGAGPLAPPGDGIAVDSAELPIPAAEAQIAGNRLWMDGGVAIAQRGEGGWILGNRIAGSANGISTSGLTLEHGNVIEENLIEGAAAAGVLIENDFNEVVGNRILDSGGAGVSIQGLLLPFGAGGNVIGGEGSLDENAISGAGGPAVEIADLEETDNEVARNRGAENVGPFIDLVGAPGDPKWPNRGISPPAFATVSETGAVGFGAEPGARIRLFRKQSPALGELESFLGAATADGSGGWTVSYESPVPPGTLVAATQTSEFGGTSELAVATVPGAVGSEEGGGTAVPGAASQPAIGGFPPGNAPVARRDRRRPVTTILRGPRGRIRHRSVTFRFKASVRGAVFLCKLDRRPFDLCRSPRRYRHLKRGRHVFRVRAVGSTGRLDRTPATRRFAVVR